MHGGGLMHCKAVQYETIEQIDDRLHRRNNGMTALASIRKRPILLLGLLAVVLFAVGAGGLLLLERTPQHRINEEGFAEIREGMTLAEVEVILGVPPGHYGARRVRVAAPANVLPDDCCRNWSTSDFAIRVYFNPGDGRVAFVRKPAVIPEQTFLDGLYRLLGL
jgi:hypothetical protein